MTELVTHSNEGSKASMSREQSICDDLLKGHEDAQAGRVCSAKDAFSRVRKTKGWCDNQLRFDADQMSDKELVDLIVGRLSAKVEEGISLEEARTKLLG